MSNSSISPDLIITIIFGLLQVLVGIMSLWQQWRFCQIGMNLRTDATPDPEAGRRMASATNIEQLARSDSDATIVEELAGAKECEKAC
ncbi:hypothetical protein FKW77_006579 [Venturia effusa]|uniref:Uncharacterized protein n=1 Tax=Venturia effusa TaxID=50376 RepID=A0A517LAZ5_9PEZI|nr:hypothetical protein FKW77_006579 [Venturia effusa]